jgi:mono/diheme cytochrome c family protein
VPALRDIVRTSDNLLARFHALWTLEGLGALDLAIVREQMKDANPRMRIQAIRASETLYKAGARALADDYRAITKDSDADVALQGMLTANFFNLPNVEALIRETMDSSKARGIQEIGQRLLQRIADAATTAAAGFTPEQLEQLKQGETTYKTLCTTCHGEDGRGMAVAGATDGAMMAPPLAASARVQGHRNYVIGTLLHGMTGPLAGKTYTQVMLPMGTQTDEWIANIASYVRNQFGNSAPFITPEQVARMRRATATRKGMWTPTELEASLPRLLPADPTWKATASHNVERAPGGLTLAAWTTAAPQAPNMWFQVEMPRIETITEVQFDSGPPGGAVRRGGRAGIPAGRGAAAATPAQAAAQSQPAAGRGGPPPFGSYPIAYRVQMSKDGKSWSAPVGEGEGSTATTIVTFRPVEAKFIRVTQTGSAPDALPWSVLNFRVYASNRRPGD